MGEPFDHSKWSFILVLIVFCWILTLATMILGACAFEFLRIGPGFVKICDFQGKFMELINTILASALAFAAGRVSNVGKSSGHDAPKVGD